MSKFRNTLTWSLAALFVAITPTYAWAASETQTINERSSLLGPAEDRRRKEEDRRRQEDQRRRQEEERRRREDENRRRQEEQRRRQEDQRRRQEEERRRRDEENRRRQEEQRRRDEENRRRQEEQRRRDEENRRRQEEQRRRDEENRRRQEEERRRREEEARRREEEARRHHHAAPTPPPANRRLWGTGAGRYTRRMPPPPRYDRRNSIAINRRGGMHFHVSAPFVRSHRPSRFRPIHDWVIDPYIYFVGGSVMIDGITYRTTTCKGNICYYWNPTDGYDDFWSCDNRQCYYCNSNSCWSGRDDGITFKDPAFERCVRAKLNKPAGRLTNHDIGTIRNLDCRGYGIRSLDGLENLEELYSLDITDNCIHDFSILDELDISANHVTGWNRQQPSHSCRSHR